MKEIRIIQSDDGSISVESDGQEPQPFTDPGEALEFVQNQIGMKTTEGEGPTSESEPGEDMGMPSESMGKKLEDMMPMVDKKKKGMMPETQADWSDYSGVK